MATEVESRALPVEPGSMLGGYKLGAVIGRGGTGVVYHATRVDDGREFALKVVEPALARDESFRLRFRREAVTLLSLDHPNIRAVYDVGEEAGVLYVSMQYVEGTNLATRIERDGRIAPHDAGRIVAQVAAALDEAHGRGLIHRDVKPHNVLLGPGDHAFLTDFGLVRPIGTSGETLTTAGEFTGSLYYIAPEQLLGNREDARVDVYALGCLLYHCLTGSPPFHESSGTALMLKHLSENPTPPSAIVEGLDQRLDGMLARALAKEPAERYAAAGDLGAAMLAITEVPALAVAAVQATPGAAPPVSANAGPAPGPTPEPAPTPGPTVAAPGSPRQALRIRLGAHFRFVHHPLSREEDFVPLLGDVSAMNRLRDRILHSDGGSFLVTGFRGVGKTTLVERALAGLGPNADKEHPVVHVRLNVARPRSVDELLFEVIRRCFECLKDQQLLGRLSPAAQRELMLAYLRTSMSFNQSRSTAGERSRSMTISLPEPLRQLLSPSFELSSKQTEELATQAAFLTYSGSDAEHDFLRIVELVSGQRTPPEPSAQAPRRRRLWRRRDAAPEPRRWRGKLVVVLDELDKLTGDAKGRRCLDELFSGLKNLLVARGVHFVFVGGPELHDKALLASRRGNSVYESVFAWQLYVPCVWSATDELLAAVVDRGDSTARNLELLQHQLETLSRYLRFKGRGVPRLMLGELNSFVAWDGERPWLTLSEHDLARAEHYARLDRDIDEFLQREGRVASGPIDDDRQRLAAYYLTDRILRMDHSSFTVDDILGNAGDGSVDAMLMPSREDAEQLLAHLDGRILKGPSASTTYFGDIAEDAKVYALIEEEVRRQRELASVNERERAELSPTLPPEDANGARQPDWRQWVGGAVGAMIRGRYELLAELDKGGYGRVYRARDVQAGVEVAVKIIDVPALAQDERVRARLIRSADLAVGLRHANIARTHEAFAERETLGIVMDYVDGVPLVNALATTRMTAAEAVGIAAGLASALEYLQAHGIARLDLKPSRIMLARNGMPVLLELGLARKEFPEEDANVTAQGVVIGSPAYMAPEQITGQPIDIRADIYALGMILYEMIAGRPARDPESSPIAMMQAALTENLELGDLPGSPELRAVIGRCVARAPGDRFANPHELRLALERTPEAQGT